MGVRARRSGALAACAASVLVAAGCGVSEHDIVREARARGGGVTAELVVDAVAAVAERQDVDTVALRSVTVVFTQVVLEVGVPEGDDDTVGDGSDVAVFEYGTSGRFGAHGLQQRPPMVPSSTDVPLSTSLFTAEDAGIERFDHMVDAALERAGIPDAYVAGATIARPPVGGDPLTVVMVTDGRRSVDVVVGPDAQVVEVRP